MKILAKRGKNTYLILTKDHEDPLKRKGRVLSVICKTLYPEMKLDSILMRGYWEEYKGSQDKLKELLKSVENKKTF